MLNGSAYGSSKFSSWFGFAVKLLVKEEVKEFFASFRLFLSLGAFQVLEFSQGLSSYWLLLFYLKL